MEVAGRPPGEPALVEFSWKQQSLELYVPSLESVREAAFIVKEVIEENCYFKHGIMIYKGATVIDIGANIGLFGIKALSLVPGGDVTYIAVEPCPPLFTTMKCNLLCEADISSICDSSGFHYNEGLQHVVQPPLPGRISAAYPGNVQLFNVAISSKPGSAPITYYPRVPGNSTLRPVEKQLLQGSMMQHLLQDSQTFEVPVIPLHQLLQEAKVVNKQIDLVKIDVEGEELNVLLGMKEEDWACVQQVVMEVHDVEAENDEASAACAAVASTQQMETASSHASAAITPTVTCATAAPVTSAILPSQSHGAMKGLGDITRRMDSPAACAHCGSCIQGMKDECIMIAAGDVSCRGPYGKAPPAPKDGGRVLQVARLLRSFGFRVVIECSLVINEVAANYTVYARRCHVD